jgi:PucR family transcriptional regulator, purine catabolism regulatory protein
VPFVEITEQVQSAIMEHATSGARRDRDLRQVLTDALLVGAGPQELTEVLAGLVGAPVVVTTAEGALVTASGADPAGRRGRPAARRDVVLLDRLWGHVAVLPPARGDDPAVAAACAYGAEALGLALLRSAAGADLDVRRRQLLDDLTERRWRSPGELVARARVLGLSFSAEGCYAALVVTGFPAADPDAVVRAVRGALAPGAALVVDVGEDVVVVVRGSAVTSAARAVLRAVDGLGADRARVVAGTVVRRLEDVDRSVARARQALVLTPAGERIVSAGAMTARLLLAGVREEPLAAQLVREELGRLAEHDAVHGSDLVATLRTYLAHSSSKVRTAQALRVQRQTLYARLQRIEALIGDISAPHRHCGLVLALALDELGAGAGPGR